MKPHRRVNALRHSRVKTARDRGPIDSDFIAIDIHVQRKAERRHSQRYVNTSKKMRYF